MDATSEVEKRRYAKQVWWVTAAVAVVGALTWYVLTLDSRNAISACEEATKARIGSPAIADFHLTAWKEADGSYDVTGHVDSDRRYQVGCTVRDGQVVD